MRWPWQRGAPAPPPASDPPRSSSPPPSPAGWAFLPPLQRQVSDVAPSTLSPGFVSSLPTRVVPSRMGTLGHLVHPDAPGGTIASGDAGLGAPVQRAVVADLTLRAPAWGSSARTTVAAGGSSAADVPAPASRSEAAGSTTEASLPLPHEEAPSARDEGTEAGLWSTDDAGSDEPAPEESSPSGLEASSAVLADRPAPVDGIAPLPVQRERADSVHPSAVHPPGPPASPVSPSRSTSPASPAPAVRRLGLGPPLRPGEADVEAGPVVQRTDGAAASPTPTAESRRGVESPAPASNAATTGLRVGAGSRTPDAASPALAEASSSDPAPPGFGGVGEGDDGERGLLALPEPMSTLPSIDASAPREPVPRADALDGLPLVSRSGPEQAEGVAGPVADEASPGETPSAATSASERLEPDTLIEPTAPLIAQRALAPMLTPFTGTAPAAARRPHAVTVVPEPPVVQRSEAPFLADSAPPNAPREATESRSRPEEPARGGVLGWIQRLVAGRDADAAAQLPAATAAAATGTGSDPAAPNRSGSDHPSAAKGVVAQRVQMRPVSAETHAHSSEMHALAEGARTESAPAEGTFAEGAPGEGAGDRGALVGRAAAGGTWLSGAAPSSTRWAAPVGVQRSTGASIAASRSPETRASRPPASPPRTPLPVAVSTAEPVVQREAEPSDASTTVQAQPEAPTSPSAAPTSTPEPATSAPEATAAATVTAATAAAAGAAAPSPAAIETLAGQLYGPLVRRLKAELLLDRERRGLRIDGI